MQRGIAPPTMEKILAYLGLKKEIIPFGTVLSGKGEGYITSVLTNRWKLMHMTVPYFRAGNTYHSLSMLESLMGKVDRSFLATYRLVENMTYQELIDSYIEHHREKYVCIAGIVFNSVEEAVSYFKIKPDLVEKYHTITGLTKANVVLFLHYGKDNIHKLDRLFNQPTIQPTQAVTYGGNRTSATQTTNQTVIPKVYDARVGGGSASRQQPAQPVKKSITVNGKKYADLFEVVAGLNINANVLQSDIDNGMSIESAVNKQLNSRKSTRVTHNSMTVHGNFYPNLKDACEAFELNEQEVSRYKSAQQCTAYDAVMYFINKKY